MTNFERQSHFDVIRFFKFCLTGGLNTLVDFLVYLVVLYVCQNLYIAQTVGYLSGMINSYVINRSWTFQSKERFFSWQMLRFVVVNLITLAISLAAVHFLKQMMPDVLLFAGYNIAAVLVKLPIVALTIVINFVLSKIWVFKS